jgi:ferredoxin, 2Fe-2S
MPTVHFILPNGDVRLVEAKEGWSLMEAARDAAVPGIIAECGGSAVCSTCHVYVEDEWLEAVGSASELEMVTLDLAPQPTDASRLSCQIVVRPELDGLRVRVPSEQA